MYVMHQHQTRKPASQGRRMCMCPETPHWRDGSGAHKSGGPAPVPNTRWLYIPTASNVDANTKLNPTTSTSTYSGADARSAAVSSIAWRRFVVVPRKPWYGKYADASQNTVAFTSKASSSEAWSIVTSLSEAEFDASPVAALQDYMKGNGVVTMPYFRDDGAAVLTLTSSSILVVVTYVPDAGLRGVAITKTKELPDAMLRGYGCVTSCIDSDATFVTTVSKQTDAATGPEANDSVGPGPIPTPTPTQDSESTNGTESPLDDAADVWRPYKRYGLFSVPRASEEALASVIVNYVVYRGRVIQLPDSMHAVWLPAPSKALMVVQYGRAIVVREAVLASDQDMTALLDRVFVSYVSYAVPEMTSNAKYYKPITPLSASNAYDAVVVSGKGEAVLVRIRGAFAMTMVNINAALTRSLLRRVHAQQFLPGDILFQYVSEALYLVCAFAAGTVVVRRLGITSGALDAPRRLKTSVVSKGILNGEWSLLPPAVADVAATDHTVWIIAGNTRYKTPTGLIHDEGHTIRPCGTFSISHAPESVGGDDAMSWVVMTPEPDVGIPVALCTLGN